MISRALGPEIGGSIGIMFFLANVCGSALYVLGLVEAILTTFGASEDSVVSLSPSAVLPVGYWWALLYGTVVLLLCLLVCLVGAHIYARATFLIFIIVMVVLATIFASFFAVTSRSVHLPGANSSSNTANFTGFRLQTLLGNMQADYTIDYTTGVMMSFATVFAVMFNGCTGIMAGSNMSGDLKNPSYSIPRGTITAVIFTFIVYNLLGKLNTIASIVTIFFLLVYAAVDLACLMLEWASAPNFREFGFISESKSFTASRINEMKP
ncbi:hypothetical protein DNTS_009491 [Danionella cerebrum]|uniref:Solute carrier family 12 member 9 n=1 Tax=Danionella cerebrum TaxID=2873325 RepID=A0A553QSS9_9TELE|nr:hypothetical protein DNTS_009491 [Danionella translucida]